MNSRSNSFSINQSVFMVPELELILRGVREPIESVIEAVIYPNDNLVSDNKLKPLYWVSSRSRTRYEYVKANMIFSDFESCYREIVLAITHEYYKATLERLKRSID